MSKEEECSDMQKKHVEGHSVSGVGGSKKHNLIGYSIEGSEATTVFYFSDTGYKKVRL